MFLNVLKHKMKAKYGNLKYKTHEISFERQETYEEQLNTLFVKYVSRDREYDLQNEWRLILYSNDPIIDDSQNHYIMNIGQMKYAKELPVEFLADGIISTKQSVG